MLSSTNRTLKGGNKMRKELLIIVVGSSGAGKSVFIDAAVQEDHRYVTSQPMIEELRKRGVEVNHDTIFALSQEWYGKDPYWQVPFILKALEGKRFLIVDGSRRAPEVGRLEEMRRIIVVRIVSNAEDRFAWLAKRKKIGLSTIEEFKRLENDENKIMDVEKLAKMADITVTNKFSETRHQKRGKHFGCILKLLPVFLPRPLMIFLLRISVL